MFRYAKLASLAAVAALFGSQALAADLYEPPIVEAPPPPVVYEDVSYGGWYIRGDLDYHWSDFRRGEYITYGVDPITGLAGGTAVLRGSVDGAFSLGGGVGYQINKHLRTDLTGDWWFKSDFRGSTNGTCFGVPCVSTDTAAYSAFLLLANAYVDLGQWHGVTPYVGAGIGGAWVRWDDLTNTDITGTVVHRGSKNWRFAYAVMAGASYCLTEKLKLDAGYRYSRIGSGRMFDWAAGVGPGYDGGFDTHEVRAGLRYQFGNSDCYEPAPYQPEPEPIYTK